MSLVLLQFTIKVGGCPKAPGVSSWWAARVCLWGMCCSASRCRSCGAEASPAAMLLSLVGGVGCPFPTPMPRPWLGALKVHRGFGARFPSLRVQGGGRC